jgi:hypothetical protein
MEEKKLTLTSLNKKLDEKMEKITNSITNIALVVEELANKDKKIGQVIGERPAERVVEAPPTIDPATPKQRKELEPELKEIFLKYFDEDDGFKAEYDTMESKFKINVPMGLSNMDEANKNFYGKDERTRKVDQNNVKGSVEQWCKLVCQNLKYNKKFKIKV